MDFSGSRYRTIYSQQKNIWFTLITLSIFIYLLCTICVTGIFRMPTKNSYKCNFRTGPEQPRKRIIYRPYGESVRTEVTNCSIGLTHFNTARCQICIRFRNHNKIQLKNGRKKHFFIIILPVNVQFQISASQSERQVHKTAQIADDDFAKRKARKLSVNLFLPSINPCSARTSICHEWRNGAQIELLQIPNFLPSPVIYYGRRMTVDELDRN